MAKVGAMAYPEPVPAVKGKKAKEFHERLDSFKLKESQKSIYRDARKNYRRKSPDKD